MTIHQPISKALSPVAIEPATLARLASELFNEATHFVADAKAGAPPSGIPQLEPVQKGINSFETQAIQRVPQELDTLDRLAQQALQNFIDPAVFHLPGQEVLERVVREIANEGRLGNPKFETELIPFKTSATQAFRDTAARVGTLDVHSIRRDFPILSERINGKPLVWFDNAATTQKPNAVIERLAHFYQHENSNIHRAAHELAARATDAYEDAREKVAKFLGAKHAEEIVFVRGATEGINLIANSFGDAFIKTGDEIIVSHLEHHANIVPWQQVAAKKGAMIKVIPVDDNGQILLDEFRHLINPRTKLVSISHVSNALGTVVPVAKVIQIAHAAGVRVLVDGAQSVSHMPVNVSLLDADLYVFSGHKLFGPTGIGVIFGKQELLNQLPPWQGGGNMIVDVTFERTVYQDPPSRFEAGTGNIADAVGLGAAIDYIQRIGMHEIAKYEHDLLEYAQSKLSTIPGSKIIGTANDKAGVLSFVLEGMSTEAVGTSLNKEGIAVRAGHHCAQPILRRFGLEKTVRASLAFYNTCDEVDHFIEVLRRISNQRFS